MFVQRIGRFVWVGLSTLSLLLALPDCLLAAGEAPPTTASPATAIPPSIGTTKDLTAKRAQAAQRIAELEKRKTAEPVAGAKATGATAAQPDSTALDLEIEQWTALDLVYVQHLATLDQRVEIDSAMTKLASEHQALRSANETSAAAAASFDAWDQARDEFDVERARLEKINNDLTGAKQLLDAARQDQAQTSAELRRLEDGGEAMGDAALALRLAQAQCAVSEAASQLRADELSLHAAKLELSKNRCDYLRDKAELLGRQAHFTKADFEHRLSLIAKARQDIEAKLHAAEQRTRQLEGQHLTALAKLQAAKADASVLEAASEAYELARQFQHEELTLFNKRLLEIDHFKHIIEYRHKLAEGGVKHEEATAWREEATAMIDRLKSREVSFASLLDEIQTAQSELLHRLNSDDANAAQLKPWLESEASQLQRLAQLCETSGAQVRASQRAVRRFLTDIELLATPTFTDRLNDAKASFFKVWNFELEKVDDQTVTIGKIVSAFLYVVAGVFAARVMSRLIGHRVLPHFGFNEGARTAVQSMVFYLLAVLFSMMSLELVKLPFAAFTFLGGAAAIAIGFGSQNILNNFMSGLILLAEQPLRVGDLVDIEGTLGVVQQIGARSTRVRTMLNSEIVVPNSRLLENKVTNLTLTDNLSQSVIGVTLGASLPASEVRRRLLDAAIRHPRVLKTPAPVALFLSFSKTELSFELRFWIRLTDLLECRVVESEIRERISVTLREADPATTAAPQTSPPAGENRSVPAKAAQPSTMDRVGRQLVAVEVAQMKPNLRKAG